MGDKIGHEGIVSQVFFKGFVDLRYHGGVTMDELVECLFSEVKLGGSVVEKIELELVEVGGDVGGIVGYIGHVMYII